MMKKLLAKIIIPSTILLLAACGGEAVEFAEASELHLYALVDEATENEIEVEEVQNIEAAIDDEEYEPEEDEEEPPEEVVRFVPPTMQISEYGRQVAADFLSTMTTIFTGVPHVEIDWGGDGTPTGYFTYWNFDLQLQARTSEVPEIYFGPTETGQGAFFDAQGSRIHDAPWLYAFRGEGWSSYSYAGYFKIFDFDGNGIPDIFIHFNQTFEGGYAGFYRVFRYVNGQYRMLETRAFENGAESPWPWLSAIHDLFWDDSGRIITHINTDYSGIYRYEHLVLTDYHAEMHLVATMNHDEWDAWQEHHWSEWGQTPFGWGMLDGWLVSNPTIFGTDISLVPLHSLTSLEDAITVSILEKLGL